MAKSESIFETCNTVFRFVYTLRQEGDRFLIEVLTDGHFQAIGYFMNHDSARARLAALVGSKEDSLAYCAKHEVVLGNDNAWTCNLCPAPIQYPTRLERNLISAFMFAALTIWIACEHFLGWKTMLAGSAVLCLYMACGRSSEVAK